MAAVEGKVTATISRPIIMRAILTVKPSIKETIWFRVRLEVNNPIETKDPARKILPIYWETEAPQSKSPALVRVKGIPIVAKMAIDTNNSPEVNFAKRTTQPLIGCVSSVSSVPSRCSSESNLMVAAGMNSANSHGKEGLSIAKSTVNRGLNEASPINKADWKNDQESIATKTTIKIYPVGWSKYPLRSFFIRAIKGDFMILVRSSQPHFLM